MAATLLLLAPTWGAAAQAPPLLRDTSFLIEESWTLRPGVIRKVSFVDFLEDATDCEYSADVSLRETHQVSLTIPIAHTRNFADDPSHEHFGRSLGDVMVSYGVELARDAERLSVAPSVGILLPTGDADSGYGVGASGAQFHLPVSVRINANLSVQTFTEATFFRGSRELRVAQKLSYLLRPNVNTLLEALYLSDGSEEHLYVSPGVRWASRRPNGWHFIPGIAMPVGLSRGTERVQVLVYLSVLGR